MEHACSVDTQKPAECILSATGIRTHVAPSRSFQLAREGDPGPTERCAQLSPPFPGDGRSACAFKDAPVKRKIGPTSVSRTGCACGAVSNARLLPLRHTGSDHVQRTALKADVGIARSLLDSRDGLVAGGLRFCPHSHNDNWRRACWPLLVLLYALVLQALSEAA
jgi:hypothetical protein